RGITGSSGSGPTGRSRRGGAAAEKSPGSSSTRSGGRGGRARRSSSATTETGGCRGSAATASPSNASPSPGRGGRAFPIRNRGGWRGGGVWAPGPPEGQVRHYSADGKLLHTIRAKENPEATWDKPMGICLAPSGDSLYVSDLAGSILRLSVPPR